MAADSLLVPGRFDAESERRLRSGRLTVEARLDLHGMSEAKAHEAVLAFLTAAIAAKRGLVLIITGKGSPDKGQSGMGILKRNLAPWLEAAPPSLRRRIRALRPAEPHDGGDGALYVLLKRK